LVFAFVHTLALQARASVFFHDPPPRSKNVQQHFEQKVILNFVMQGKCQKWRKKEKSVDSGPYYYDNSTKHSDSSQKLAKRPENSWPKGQMINY
jgi:hypothetical protein